MATPPETKEVSATRPHAGLSDEELFAEIREQVNISRNFGNHDRLKTRQLSAEAAERGWNLRNTHDPGRTKSP